MKIFSLIALFLATVFDGAMCGNILLWMSMGSPSHYNLWKPLALQLAKRNHTLTVVTPHPYKALQGLSNVKYIQVETDLSSTMNSTEVFEGGTIWDFDKFAKTQAKNQDIIFSHPDIKALIEQNPKFDVTIISSPFCHDMGLYLAKERFKSPVILFFPGLKWTGLDVTMGNPINPSYIPLEMLSYSQHMTFPERVFNTIMVMATAPINSWYIDPPMADKLKEIFHLKERPNMAQLAEEASFAFYNAHASFDLVAPVNPNTALVGGLHLGPAAPLTGDFKTIMDEAKDGVILVSFGSVLTGSHLPEAKRKILVDTFSKLKQKVIWKWETEEMAGKPDNVLLKKWLPQQDILAHPNVKLFITHGGLLSTEEALYNRVPMIVMPGFADQFANAARTERMGYGRELRWSDLGDHNLLAMIKSILVDASFKERAEYYGNILSDNQVHSLDTAVFYTEYIMRHKGAPHLRSPSKDLYWFQYLLLDVLALVVAVLTTVLFVVYKVGRAVVRKVCGSRKVNSAKPKQN